MKKILFAPILLAFVLLAGCSSTPSPYTPTATPRTDFSGFWNGTLESSNCATNGTGSFTLYLTGDPETGYTGELYSRSTIPVKVSQYETGNGQLLLSDTANLSGYSLSMDLEMVYSGRLEGEFTEVSSNGCNQFTTKGAITLTK